MTDDVRSAWDEMNDQLDQDFPESFIFNTDEPGKDRIIGKFKRVDTGPSQYTESGNVPIYVLDVEGREYGLWGIHQVLRDRFAEARPQPGDLVGVKYQGQLQPKSGRGNSYHGYKVVVQRHGSTEHVDWSLYGGLETPIAPAEDTHAVQQASAPVDDWGQPEPQPMQTNDDSWGEASPETYKERIRTALTTRQTTIPDVLSAFEAVGVQASSVGEAVSKAQLPQLMSVANKVAQGII